MAETSRGERGARGELSARGAVLGPVAQGRHTRRAGHVLVPLGVGSTRREALSPPQLYHLAEVQSHWRAPGAFVSPRRMDRRQHRRLLAVRQTEPVGVLLRSQAAILGAVHGEGARQTLRQLRGGGAGRLRRRPANADGRALRGHVLADELLVQFELQVGHKWSVASDRRPRQQSVHDLEEDHCVAQARLSHDYSVLQRESPL